MNFRTANSITPIPTKRGIMPIITPCGVPVKLASVMLVFMTGIKASATTIPTNTSTKEFFYSGKPQLIQKCIPLPPCVSLMVATVEAAYKLTID